MSSLELGFKSGLGGFRFFCSCGARYARRKDLLEHVGIANVHFPLPGDHREVTEQTVRPQDTV